VKRFDAMVIGAGPAGATAALLLARAGWSVAVVEKAPFPRRKVCGEFISATSLPILRDLGIDAAFLSHAGPPVRNVGLYAGGAMHSAAMPQPAGGTGSWGRALGREHLDALLLNAAAAAGAEVLQPRSVTSLDHGIDGFVGTLIAQDRQEPVRLRARIIVAAHGSWESGGLPTNVPARPAQPSDLFAFKAHFRDASLPTGLMPLLVFRGGYGGMVQCDDGRTSISCCIRRDMLARCRAQAPGTKAAEAVLSHIRESCRGVDLALTGALREGAWLSTGPIRPGIRPFRRDGIYAVGNAAGEAHPIIAEGISIAMQSSWLLCRRLIGHRPADWSQHLAMSVADQYAADWRGNFVPRLRIAGVLAHLATQPGAGLVLGAVVKRIPSILTFGAYLSGKAHSVRPQRESMRKAASG